MGDIIPYKKTGRVKDGIVAVLIFTIVVLLLCGVCALTFTMVRFMSGESMAANTDAVSSMNLPVIVIDAGHGGYDPGAFGVSTKTPESDINLDIAKKLEKKKIIENSQSFYIRGTLSTNEDRKIIPGTYKLSSTNNYDEILDILTNNDTIG